MLEMVVREMDPFFSSNMAWLQDQPNAPTKNEGEGFVVLIFVFYQPSLKCLRDVSPIPIEYRSHQTIDFSPYRFCKWVV
jgi:hypothetical protein